MSPEAAQFWASVFFLINGRYEPFIGGGNTSLSGIFSGITFDAWFRIQALIMFFVQNWKFSLDLRCRSQKGLLYVTSAWNECVVFYESGTRTRPRRKLPQRSHMTSQNPRHALRQLFLALLGALCDRGQWLQYVKALIRRQLKAWKGAAYSENHYSPSGWHVQYFAILCIFANVFFPVQCPEEFPVYQITKVFFGAYTIYRPAIVRITTYQSMLLQLNAPATPF